MDDGPLVVLVAGFDGDARLVLAPGDVDAAVDLGFGPLGLGSGGEESRDFVRLSQLIPPPFLLLAEGVHGRGSEQLGPHLAKQGGGSVNLCALDLAIDGEGETDDVRLVSDALFEPGNV